MPPDLVDRLGTALLDAGLAATAIAGLVVLAMIQCRQPARRRDWARAGLISTLALLPIAALNPVPRIDVRGTLRSLLPPELDRSPVSASADPFFSVEESAESAICPSPGTPAVRRPMRQVARAMVFAYLGGAFLGLAWITLGVAGAAWLVHRAWSASSETEECYRSLPFQGRRTRPTLKVSGWTSRPVLVGWPRSTILIPPALDDPSAKDRLRLSLLHELAHAEGADDRFGLASRSAQAFWFFLPPLWWLSEQLRLDQEFLADRRAVENFGTTGGYAASLVDLASPIGKAGLGPGLAPAGGSPVDARRSSPLFQRVVMLLKCPFVIEGQPPLWWRWTTATTLALTTVAASSLTVRGLAGWSTVVASVASTEPQTFRLPDLAIGSPDRDDPPFDLRFRLPERFTLTFEVWAAAEDLPRIEVLGHPLGSFGKEIASGPTEPAWRQARIIRADGAEQVEVAGRPLGSGPGAFRLSTWLTVRPIPGQATRFREIAIAW